MVWVRNTVSRRSVSKAGDMVVVTSFGPFWCSLCMTNMDPQGGD